MENKNTTLSPVTCQRSRTVTQLCLSDGKIFRNKIVVSVRKLSTVVTIEMQIEVYFYIVKSSAMPNFFVGHLINVCVLPGFWALLVPSGMSLKTY